ncbi:MAG: hypothetical protein A2X49_13755 [Lentisphaerae bacterium GWF2_52_8]|nr:MAG: hypothetical protein A2X49_13755 [Lentisphaerae bacterium GWF2_52_8]
MPPEVPGSAVLEPGSPEGDGGELLTSPPAGQAEKSFRKEFLIVGFFALAIVAAYLSPLREWLQRVPELSEAIRGWGFWAPMIFVPSVMILIALGLPRLLVCPIAGMAFGFWYGMLWSQVGTLLAYYVVFLFVRWGGRAFVVRHSPRAEKLSHFVAKGGIPAVIIARQMPVHGFLVNLVLGLSPVRHFDFIVGTAIGVIPEAVPCVLVGSGAAQGSALRSAAYVGGAMLILALAWLAMNMMLRAKKRGAQQTIIS